MTKLKQYQVDAFTNRVFEGNPAAVCPLEYWLEDAVLQSIASENNLAETAFFVPAGNGFDLRWFTPVKEVNLCGHATLASAHVIFEILDYADPLIRFQTRSGELTVQRKVGLLEMDFPALTLTPCTDFDVLAAALGQRPIELFTTEDYVAVFDNEAAIRAMKPDHGRLSQLDLRAVIVTAPGIEFDFVSRVFAPKYGIPEDPVTGSAHCALAPYWAKKLNKNNLNARQVSARGGNIGCELKADRVLLCGHAVTFMTAEIMF